jgi:hypothetical protein
VTAMNVVVVVIIVAVAEEAVAQGNN